MDGMEMLLNRRSIRKYKPDMVPKELIEEIAKAGSYAPSGMGMQSPIIIAVTNKEIRDKLSRINAEIWGRPDMDPFYGAPVVLVVLADRACRNFVYDGSVVMENLMLAAHSMGLGSCWIHRAKEAFERPESKEILKSLGIQGDYEGIGHCILGYPAQAPKPAAPRKENYIYYLD